MQDADTITIVSDIYRSPPETDKYKKLKECILERLMDSPTSSSARCYTKSIISYHDFTTVLHIELYSRLDCGHFVDLENYDAWENVFKYAAVLPVARAVQNKMNCI